MFTGDFKESNQQLVEIPKMDAAVFKLLMEYIYTDEVSLNSESAVELLKVADEYLIPRLKHVCELFLIQNLNEFDIITIINLSVKHESPLLKKIAVKQLLGYSKNQIKSMKTKRGKLTSSQKLTPITKENFIERIQRIQDKLVLIEIIKQMQDERLSMDNSQPVEVETGSDSVGEGEKG